MESSLTFGGLKWSGGTGQGFIHSPHNTQQSADLKRHITTSQNGPRTGTEEEERDQGVWEHCPRITVRRFKRAKQLKRRL